MYPRCGLGHNNLETGAPATQTHSLTLSLSIPFLSNTGPQPEMLPLTLDFLTVSLISMSDLKGMTASPHPMSHITAAAEASSIPALLFFAHISIKPFLNFLESLF